MDMDDEVGDDGTEPEEFVRALARGLAVIEAFDHAHPAQTLSEVAKRAGVSRATARRLLLTLIALGYAAQTGRQFTLRPKVLNLGLAYLASFSLASLAHPFLEDLAGRIHESCSIAVLDGTDIVYVARVSGKRIMSIDISIGTRLPAVVTSLGRVLLADLPAADLEAFLTKAESCSASSGLVGSQPRLDRGGLRAAIHQCRQAGWALVDQELEQGLRSVAAPIRGRDGSVVAAINVGTNAAAVPLERLMSEIIPALLATAAQLSQAMRLA